MKRSDIVRSIQIQFNRMTEKDAAAILDSVANKIKDSVAAGDKIEIRGFGTIQSRDRAPKMGYNPTNDQPMFLDAGKTILFKPSRELTKQMNG